MSFKEESPKNHQSGAQSQSPELASHLERESNGALAVEMQPVSINSEPVQDCTSKAMENEITNPLVSKEQETKDDVVELLSETTLRSQIKLLSQLATAIGNFSVQYNFQSISVALLVMSQSQCTADDDACKSGDQLEWVKSSASSTIFAGAITGQLAMGYAGDVMGRTKAMAFTLSLVVLGAILSAAAPAGDPVTIYATIIVSRFILGIGVGGIYPLSATKAAEDGGKGGGSDGSKDAVNSNAAAWAFFYQTPGSMTPWFVAYIITFSNVDVNAFWRLLLGLGSVPAALVVGLTMLEMRYTTQLLALTTSRLTAPETGSRLDSRPSKQGAWVTSPMAASVLLDDCSAHVAVDEAEMGDIGRDSRASRDSAASRSQSVGDGPMQIDSLELVTHDPDLPRKLLITGGCWFIYDVAYYGVQLFGGEVLQKISDRDDDNVSAMSNLRRVASQQLIALSMGLPAVLLSIALLELKGLKWLQTAGFTLITISFVLLASTFKALSNQPDLLFTIYCLLLFSLSFGPNVTTYVSPARVYPKEVRTTFNGVCAASGKLGAVVGVYMFSAIADVSSYPVVMVVSAVISLVGALVTQIYMRADEV